MASHPSLILYCGNNEGVKHISTAQNPDPDAQASAAMDYAALFDNVVRRATAEEDPSRYLSPSNGNAIQPTTKYGKLLKCMHTKPNTKIDKLLS